MATNTDTHSRCIELPLDMRAAMLAREFVRETLAQWNCRSCESEVALAVSELVTNAVVHARSATKVTLVNSDGTVQIRVHDEDSNPPSRRTPMPQDTSGRGVMLVEAVSTSWGVQEDDPSGKTVWLDVSKS